MTDLSKLTLAMLKTQSDAVNAEIERRKAEPDWEAWEPKWQAFNDVMGFQCSDAWGRTWKQLYLRALIAAHNAPLAGEDEDWTEYQPKRCAGPHGISTKTHEIQIYIGEWEPWAPLDEPTWTSPLYRYRPKQTDEVRP
jgi:hypothetical protein